MGDSALRRGRRAVGSLVALIVVAVLGAQARAASDPAQVCSKKQLQAAGKLFKASEACWSHALSSLTFDLDGCLVRAENHFAGTYSSALAKAQKAGSQCGLRMDVGSLLSLKSGAVDPLVSEIAGSLNFANGTDRKLRSKLVSAAASFSSKAFAAEVTFSANNDPNALATKLADAQTKLESSFASLTTGSLKHGVLYDGIPAGEVSDSLEQAAALWERLTRPDQGAFTVAGTVFAADASTVDSDVNDTSTVPVSNDDFFSAQPLTVPVTVGGYLNQPHVGPDGNSWEGGDLRDRYLVTLKTGQVIALVLGDDPSVSDLDVCLIGPTSPGNPNPNQACTTGVTGSLKLLSAPSDGSYFIEVLVSDGCDCSGTYTLSVGLPAPAAAAKVARTDLDFVPNQLIVTLKSPQEMAASGLAAPSSMRAQASAMMSDLGMAKLGGDASREMLLQLPPAGAPRVSTMQKLGAVNQQETMTIQSLTAEQAARHETILAMKALRQRADVKSVELNTIMHASAIPDDPRYPLQWHYPLIHLPQAWDIVTGDPNVIVAVVDTGARLDHPDLQGSFVAGYDFISDATRARDGDGIDPDPNDPGDKGAGTGGSSFHGTHVAGTIAAQTNNGIGVAGVSWGAKVMPIRVLGLNGGTQFDVLQGVRYAAGLSNDSGTVPAKKADIINLSLGGGGFSQSAQDVFTAVRAAGVIVVAAAGNDGSSAPSFPAAYDGVVSVAAVDFNRNPAFYSNFGSTVDVAAPGGDTSVDLNGDGFADGVLSTLADDTVTPLVFDYVFYQGTSMATPHVSGVFALMRSVDRNISPATIDTLLSSGSLTDDLMTPGRDDDTGWGLIDAQKAVVAAGGPPPAAPELSVTPSSLNFGISLDTIDFTVANTGTNALTISSVSVLNPSSAPWLSVAAQSVDGSGLGSYRAAVDRTGLTKGASFNATISVVSNHGTIHLPVAMRVAPDSSTADAGFHYILLVDAQSLTAIAEIAEPATNGAYAYSFANVPQGDYLLIAGSDMDDDQLICDGGEACGSYPTLDLPAPITVDQDRTGIDFGTAFRQSLATSSSALAIPTSVPAGLRRLPPKR
ncbi:MAG TPA: S8 family serine peptidase [Myxococcota bacterium]|nr:S8 family serine peptidase [Myxococcota bacterium]